MTTINEGRVYRYKGVLYTVLKLERYSLIQYKDEWHPSVRYTTTEAPAAMAPELTFNRAIPEFLEKFEAVS